MTTSNNEPSPSDQRPGSPGRADRSPSCPEWCTFDHEGPFFADPGEHERYLTSTHLRNFVSLHTADDGKLIEVSVWLLGNGVVEIPFDANSAAQLRAWAAMLEEAATEVDGLADNRLLSDVEDKEGR